MNREMRFLGPALVILTMGLVSFGLIMVFSAGAFISFDPDKGGITLWHFSRQLLFVGIGMLAMLFFANYDYARLAQWGRPMLFVVIILLLLVLYSPWGVGVRGGRRWLDLGPLPNLQPSEFLKLAVIIYLAERWSNRQEELRRFFSGVLPNMLLVGLAIGLVLVEPHKSATLILGALVGAIWFIAGGRMLHLFVTGAVFLAAMGFVIANSKYGMERITGFLNQEETASGAGWHATQAQVALARGGLSGQGLGEGLHKVRYIPDPHTDYIFAVVGEELGFLATGGLALVFLAFTWLGVRTAAKAPDRLGYLLAAGATVLLALQALLHMSVVANLLPGTGVPLPFISYGGNSIIVTLCAVGLIVNVSRSAVPVPVSPRRGARAHRAA